MAREHPHTGTGESLYIANLDLIERVTKFVCRRHYLAPAEAEEFGSDVLFNLLENDYAILNAFEGRSSLRAFLSTVIQRQFLDRRNHLWGKWRPCALAKRLGPVAILLDRLTSRDGHSFGVAYEIMTTNHGVTDTRAELEAMFVRFPIREGHTPVNEEVLVNVAADVRNPEQLVVDREAEEKARQVSKVLRDILARLDVQDHLMLKMRYKDGRTVTAIALTLGLEQKPLFRRFDRLEGDLKVALEAEGIDRTVVRDLLENGLDSDWGSS